MNLIFKCIKCKRVLKTETHNCGIDDIVIKVTPCDNIECRDCSDCEIEQENIKIKKQLKGLAYQLEGITKKTENITELKEPEKKEKEKTTFKESKPSCFGDHSRCTKRLPCLFNVKCDLKARSLTT